MVEIGRMVEYFGNLSFSISIRDTIHFEKQHLSFHLACWTTKSSSLTLLIVPIHEVCQAMTKLIKNFQCKVLDFCQFRCQSFHLENSTYLFGKDYWTNKFCRVERLQQYNS